MSTELPKFVVPGQLLSPLYKTTDDEKLIQKFEAGNGVIIQEINLQNETQSVLSATLLGLVHTEEIKEEPVEETEEEKQDGIQLTRFRISVIPSTHNDYRDYSAISSSQTQSYSNSLPKEGDIVLTRVTRLSLKQANVEILAVEGSGNVLTDSGIGANGTGDLAPGGGSAASNATIHKAGTDLGETFKGIIRSQDVRSTERDKVKIIESFKPGDIVRAQILSLGDGSNYYLTTARNDLGVVFAKSHNGNGGLMYAIDWQTMICAKNGEIELRKCAKPF